MPPNSFIINKSPVTGGLNLARFGTWSGELPSPDSPDDRAHLSGSGPRISGRSFFRSRIRRLRRPRTRSFRGLGIYGERRYLHQIIVNAATLFGRVWRDHYPLLQNGTAFHSAAHFVIERRTDCLGHGLPTRLAGIGRPISDRLAGTGGADGR